MSVAKIHGSFLRALWLCLVGLLVFLAVAAGLLSRKNNGALSSANTANTTQIIRSLLQLDAQMGRSILRQGIPIIHRNAGEEESDRFLQVKPVELFLQLALNMRYPSPQELIKAQIPIIEWRYAYHAEPVTNRIIRVSTVDESNHPMPFVPQPPSVAGKPQVLIYHTHTSECYLPSSGLEHRLNQRGDIVKVGRFLTEALSNKGISCIHTDEIHDQYPFRDSYKRSQKTVINILEENPSLRMVLDIHRDGVSVFEKSPKIHGQRVAKIVFVVGSNRMGLSHPQWRKNYQFAVDMADIVNRRYPGLVGRVIVSDARYNQHLHHHAIIVEVGNQNTRPEEAERSVAYLADAIEEYLLRYPDHSDHTNMAVETSTHPQSAIR